MPELSKIIIASAGFSALFSAAIIWLFKNWISERLKNAIKHEYDQKLETHKAQLKAQSEVEIEKLKFQMQMMATERNIKLTSIFEQQKEIVEKVYAKVMSLNDAIVGFGQSLYAEAAGDKSKLVDEAYNEFQLYYYPKAIYLPKEVVGNIGKLTRAVNLLVRNYKQIMILEKSQPQSVLSQQAINKKLEDVPEQEADLEKCLVTIINDFQHILGFQISDDSRLKK